MTPEELSQFFSLLLKLLAKNGEGFLTILGLISAVVGWIWLRRTRWWRRLTGQSEDRRSPEGAWAPMIGRIVDALNSMAESLREEANAIREQTKAMNDNFAEIHREIRTLKGRASHG